jgi:hypothetical protein
MLYNFYIFNSYIFDILYINFLLKVIGIQLLRTSTPHVRRRFENLACNKQVTTQGA